MNETTALYDIAEVIAAKIPFFDKYIQLIELKTMNFTITILRIFITHLSVAWFKCS